MYNEESKRSTLDARRSTLDARRSTLDARRSTLDARRYEKPSIANSYRLILSAMMMLAAFAAVFMSALASPAWADGIGGNSGGAVWLDANGSHALYINSGGNVGIGSTSPQASLDLSQKTDAAILPVGTTAQQPTCNSTTKGAIRYNSTDGVPEFCNGSAWNPFSGSCSGSTTGPDTSLASGLLAYWGLNEGNGTQIYDSSGNNYNGKWSGTLGSQWTTGKIGNAGNFSSNTYTSMLLAFNVADVTISAWFKTTSNSEFIFYTQSNNPLVYMEVGPTTAGGTANKLVSYFRTNSGSVLVASGATTINDGNWHFGVIVRNATTQTVKIYVDGSLDSTTSYTDTGAITTSSAALSGLTYSFSGSIDEVGVWSRALSAAEISTLYNSGNGNAFNAFVCPAVIVSSGGFAN